MGLFECSSRTIYFPIGEGTAPSEKEAEQGNSALAVGKPTESYDLLLLPLFKILKLASFQLC